MSLHCPVSEMLPVEAIAVRWPRGPAASVITSMVELAGQTGWLWDTAKMAGAVRTREDMLPTAFENGVACCIPVGHKQASWVRPSWPLAVPHAASRWRSTRRITICFS